jgi:CheY-like chemotaxis protein
MKAINAQKVFGTSVKVSRNLLGISQETLAERAALHRTYISDVERGGRNPSLKTILRLAQALEVPLSTLFPAELEYWKNPGSRDEDLNRHRVDILLVEDNADDVEMTLHSFKLARFANRIHVVSDGPEALDYLFCRGEYKQRSPGQGPQLILLDLSLPKLSGLEVLRLIKADDRTSQLPVVILTSSSAKADIAECRRLGAIAFITKPVNWQDFGVAIKKFDLNWALLKPTAARPAAVPA